MRRAGWAVAVLGTVAACAVSTPERRMGPPPSPAVLQELGFHEVVRYGEDYAVERGYDVLAVQEVYPTGPNWWRVRFSVAPEGSGRLLDLEFDGATRRVIKSTEERGVGGKVVPVVPDQRGPLGH
jgi:hypothetical protein